MFRIRQIPDDATPANASSLQQVQQLLRTRLVGVSEEDVAAIPRLLRDPYSTRFRSLLFIAEGSNGKVRGFALLKHAPDLNFCYLDYIVAAPGLGGGIGGALYERVREHAATLGATGVYLEASPDDPSLSPNPDDRRQNIARLRFYERYGTRPIAGTSFETPLRPGGTNPPYLLYDGLGRETLPSRDEARGVVRAILERKYGARCPPGYIDMVVESHSRRSDPPAHSPLSADPFDAAPARRNKDPARRQPEARHP